jgi:glutamyl-tRNA synthetase
VNKGAAYYCFCTEERLEELRSSAVGHEVVMYDKYCLNHGEDVKAKLESAIPYVIRLNIPEEGVTTFADEIYGEISVPNNELDDMVLIKSDGFPTYNFANVVDDHLMEISHVVRGNEYLSSAPKYNRLYEAFGWEVPIYVHCPLITDEDHKKLSKRSGHSSYEDLLEMGYVTEAIINFVALLGWSPIDNQEIFSLEELVKAFDYRNISKSPAVFDEVKLRWMNGEYFKKMDWEEFFSMAKPYLEEVVKKPYNLEKIAKLVQSRIEVLPDIKEQVDFFEELPTYDAGMYVHKKMKTNEETSLEVLQELLPILEEQADYSNDSLYAALVKYIAHKGCKNGFAMWPLRVAVSGKQSTPGGATEIMEILGKEESLARVKKGIELLSMLLLMSEYF